ncbi:MAG: ATP synthase F0 subunit B [Desulfobacterales bacterium]|jgi:F-type H+-transporting ATPase subunit b
MEIISNIALISINETLIVQVISFLVFLFIINRIMFRPLRSVIDERETYIQSLQNDIAAAEDEYTSLTRQINEQEATLRKEAQQITAELQKAANQQSNEIIAVTRKEIDNLKKKAEKEIEAQLIEARKQVQIESETLALSVMEKVLERGLTP